MVILRSHVDRIFLKTSIEGYITDRLSPTKGLVAQMTWRTGRQTERQTETDTQADRPDRQFQSVKDEIALGDLVFWPIFKPTPW